MVSTEKAAYIFGGANHDGPLNDLYEFNFATKQFKKINLHGVLMPSIEMHSCHVY